MASTITFTDRQCELLGDLIRAAKDSMAMMNREKQSVYSDWTAELDELLRILT